MARSHALLVAGLFAACGGEGVHHDQDGAAGVAGTAQSASGASSQGDSGSGQHPGDVFCGGRGRKMHKIHLAAKPIAVIVAFQPALDESTALSEGLRWPATYSPWFLASARKANAASRVALIVLMKPAP